MGPHMLVTYGCPRCKREHKMEFGHVGPKRFAVCSTCIAAEKAAMRVAALAHQEELPLKKSVS